MLSVFLITLLVWGLLQQPSLWGPQSLKSISFLIASWVALTLLLVLNRANLQP